MAVAERLLAVSILIVVYYYLIISLRFDPG
jgi:hypothetical protein